MAPSPKKLTTVIYFSPQHWGELDRFVRLYHETYKFDERTLHILHGVAGHFHKATTLFRVARSMSPLLKEDREELEAKGHSSGLRGAELAAIVETVFCELYSAIGCSRHIISEIYRGFRGVASKKTRAFFQNAFDGQLRHLYDLFLLIGKIPTQDFDSLFYLFSQREPIIQFITLLQKMRTPAGYAEEFGSFFAALVESGVLPKGSKKMTIGTMVLAKDGHICLSLVEKEIDDFLFENGIKHEKEVYYPNSNYRTDWELFGTGSRTFVEYFGLMSNSDYAAKTSLKQAIAVESKINLISIFPENSWKNVLLNWKTHLSE